jgi:hypothetical protein
MPIGRRPEARTLVALLAAALVCVGCATAYGSGTKKAPPGYAAVVRGIERKAGWLSMGLFDQRIEQVRAERRVTGSKGSISVPEESMRQLLEEVEVAAEAKRMGIHLSARQVTRAFRRVKRTDYSSIGEFRTFLRRIRLTESEARRRIEIQLFMERIEDRVLAGVPLTQRGDTMEHWVAWYLQKWRSKTACRPVLATERCSNGPPLAKESGSDFSAVPAPRN